MKGCRSAVPTTLRRYAWHACTLVAGLLSAGPVPVSAAEARTAATPAATVVAPQVWATTADHRLALARLPADAPVDALAPVVRIDVDPAARRQRIDGFGAAITDSSAWLLQRRMTPEARDALLRELFGPAPSIGLGFVRLTIGASDFSLYPYSLDDMPAGQRDPTLSRFHLPRQQRDALAVARDARAINPALQIMASPWSAPGWMKTTDSLIQGTLREDALDAFARYLATYVDAAAARGVPLFALTVQNEPAFEPADYPGMRLSAAQRAALIARLGPMLRAAGHDTRLLDWDHNWDKPEEPLAVLADPAAAPYVAGVAWHCYGGEVPAQSKVHDAFPDRPAYLTECSGGDWEPVRSGGMTLLARDLIVGGTRHWASGVVLWNLALDDASGPHSGGCGNCRGVVTLDRRSGTITRNDEYYVLAHASRFVRAGAYRVDSSDGEHDVDNVAFVDPATGERVLIVVNSAGLPRTIAVTSAGKHFEYTLAPKSLHTFLWPD